MTPLPIDHVLLAVPDLEAAGAMFLEEYGLASVEGGRHTGLGTANRIVPVGDRQYVELVGVVDETQAETNPFGSTIRAAVEQGGGLVAWCVRVDDAEAAGRPSGLAVTEGSRTRPDGYTLSWRIAGFEAALAEPWRPFFLEWRIPDDAHPGRENAPHRVKPSGIGWIEVACDLQVLREWAGDVDVDIRIADGPPALQRVAINTESGTVILG